ncbi:hypothetical protein RHS02_07717, partial [Rhizoctonia solani]
MMPSAQTPPTSDQYSSLHEVPSPPPQIQVPVAGPASIDEMHRVHDIEHESQDRTNPNNNTNERRHIQPISHSDNAVSFIAIIPLENLSKYGGEQLALYCGEGIGDLIVITLHNTVEAVLAIVLLVKCKLKLLQSTVIGVVLLHCLLVPGVAFLTDGTKLWAQQLKPRITKLNQSLLTIGVLSLVVPTAFFSALPYKHPEQYAPQFINKTRIATRPGLAPTHRDLLSTNLLDLNKHVLFTPPTHNASIYAIQVASTVDAVSDLTRDWLLRLSRGISIILLLV